MRTIKFRVWNPDDLKMEFPLVFSVCMSGKLQPLIKCSDGNRAYKDYPINQFTGLTDKNGVEIYEHDIIKFLIDNEKYVVQFEEGAFCLVSNNVCGIISMYDFENLEYEVIGNIHDNPELL